MTPDAWVGLALIVAGILMLADTFRRAAREAREEDTERIARTVGVLRKGNR